MSMYNHAIRRARIAIGLLLVAVVFAIIATWPAGDDAQSATFGKPTIATSTGATQRVTLTITWSQLDSSVVRLHSTISGSPGSTVTPLSKAKTVEQQVQTDVPADTTSIRVETRALDVHGQQVGVGYTRVVKLP